LDGKHVVFGKIKKGMDVLDKLEKANEKGSVPNPTIKIVDCGQITV
jgi:cyclophilin family peptidyl-prolyl cis-trans isomerase